MKNFIRKCKIEFYSKSGELLYTYNAGGGKEKNGNFSPRVVFDIVKTNSSALQTSTIKMYNLDKEGGAYLASIQGDLNVRLFAGYEDDFNSAIGATIPIYSGRICQKPKTIYSGVDVETTFYCYFGVLIKKIKVPPFSIKGLVTAQTLFSNLRSKIKSLEIDKVLPADTPLTIPEDTDLILQLGPTIMTKTIAKIGYSIPLTHTLDEFLTIIAKILSDDNNEVQWYLDDAKRQIVFYNTSFAGKANNIVKLQQGVNILEFDQNSVLQYERAQYLANLTGKQQKKHKQKENQKEIYNISTYIQKDIYLDTQILLENVEAPTNMSIQKIRYYGDTYGTGNDWRMDLELYERGK